MVGSERFYRSASMNGKSYLRQPPAKEPPWNLAVVYVVKIVTNSKAWIWWAEILSKALKNFFAMRWFCIHDGHISKNNQYADISLIEKQWKKRRQAIIKKSS